MRGELNSVVFRDGSFYIALCPEIPNAHGQGNTQQEALNDLRSCIETILQHQREEFEQSEEAHKPGLEHVSLQME